MFGKLSKYGHFTAKQNIKVKEDPDNWSPNMLIHVVIPLCLMLLASFFQAKLFFLSSFFYHTLPLFIEVHEMTNVENPWLIQRYLVPLIQNIL